MTAQAGALALALAVVAAGPSAASTLPPVAYQAVTRDYDVRLRIAPELKATPAAYTALEARALVDLKAFEAAAVKDMARARRQTPDSVIARNPEVARIEVDFVVRTPHLIGFVRRDYADAHGAHPAYAVSGLMFDTASGRRLAATDLLRPGVDTTLLDDALAEAVKAAKARRGQGGPDDLAGFAKPGDLGWTGKADLTAMHDLFASGDAADARSAAPVLATLTASSVRDRAGGLQFLYSPYDIGSYAEGAYRVVLPWRAFVASLRPLYRKDFVGATAGELAPDPLARFPADVPPITP